MDRAVSIRRVVLGDDGVHVEAGGVVDLPPGDRTERQRESPRGVAVAALVLGAEPPRPEVYEIERVALTTARADGGVCGAVAVGGR